MAEINVVFFFSKVRKYEDKYHQKIWDFTEGEKGLGEAYSMVWEQMLVARAGESA